MIAVLVVVGGVIVRMAAPDVSGFALLDAGTVVFIRLASSTATPVKAAIVIRTAMTTVPPITPPDVSRLALFDTPSAVLGMTVISIIVVEATKAVVVVIVAIIAIVPPDITGGTIRNATNELRGMITSFTGIVTFSVSGVFVI